MRVFLTVVLFLPSLALSEPKTLTVLDCSTNFGPTQQVTVKETDSAYTLIELLNSGMQVQRTLSAEEWESRRLQLRDTEFGDKAELYKVIDGWFLNINGPGLNVSGYADCWETGDHDGNIQ